MLCIWRFGRKIKYFGFGKIESILASSSASQGRKHSWWSWIWWSWLRTLLNCHRRKRRNSCIMGSETKNSHYYFITSRSISKTRLLVSSFRKCSYSLRSSNCFRLWQWGCKILWFENKYASLVDKFKKWSMWSRIW